MVGVCCTYAGAAQLRDGRKASPAPSGELLVSVQKEEEKKKGKKKETHPLKSAKGISPGVIYGYVEEEH